MATLPTGETQHLKVEDGTYTPIVTGSNITKVDIGKRSDTSTDYAVNISLDSAGAAAFAEASKDLAPTKGKIVIILDNEVQSAPRNAVRDPRRQHPNHRAITRSTRPRRCRPCWKAARCP